MNDAKKQALRALAADDTTTPAERAAARRAMRGDEEGLVLRRPTSHWKTRRQIRVASTSPASGVRAAPAAELSMRHVGLNDFPEEYRAAIKQHCVRFARWREKSGGKWVIRYHWLHHHGDGKLARLEEFTLTCDAISGQSYAEMLRIGLSPGLSSAAADVNIYDHGGYDCAPVDDPKRGWLPGPWWDRLVVLMDRFAAEVDSVGARKTETERMLKAASHGEAMALYADREL